MGLNPHDDLHIGSTKFGIGIEVSNKREQYAEYSWVGKVTADDRPNIPCGGVRKALERALVMCARGR